jgi:hypothetical protein
MSTNSRIAIMKADGKVESIYCHWNGDPADNGVVLLRHYTTEEKINKLISLGSISVLREKLQPETNNHSFDYPEKDITVAYHRDRGEELHIDKYPSIKAWGNKSNRLEWNYIWVNGEWEVQGEEHKNSLPVLDYLSECDIEEEVA